MGGLQSRPPPLMKYNNNNKTLMRSQLLLTVLKMFDLPPLTIPNLWVRRSLSALSSASGREGPITDVSPLSSGSWFWSQVLKPILKLARFVPWLGLLQQQKWPSQPGLIALMCNTRRLLPVCFV